MGEDAGTTITRPTLYITYGSQTGCAESIAKRIFHEAHEKLADEFFHDIHLSSMNDLDWNPKTDESHPYSSKDYVIMLCSTTGNGDPPENASKFWRALRRKTVPPNAAKGIQFTMLGLGDTNYDKFCHMGHSIDKRMRELGATLFYPMGAADEATGLEDVVEPWIENLWLAFTSNNNQPLVAKDCVSPTNNPTSNSTVLPSLPTSNILPQHVQSYEECWSSLSTEETSVLLNAELKPESLPRLQKPTFTCVPTQDDSVLSSNDGETGLSRCQPFTASVVSSTVVTLEPKVIHLKLNVEGSEILYTPGDALGILCPNPPSVVNYMLCRLGITDEDSLFKVEGTGRGRSASCLPPVISAKEALTHYVELCTPPRKNVIRTLASYCTEEREKEQLLRLCLKNTSSLYDCFITSQGLTVPELLSLFPSCAPPLNHILCLLPPLSPRYYSIMSSPLLNPNVIEIAYTEVKFELKNICRSGLCTTWLQNTTKIPVFLRDTREFLLPSNKKWPLILIGPGTGVAPFLGFLQHRFMQKQLVEEEAHSVCSGTWRSGVELDFLKDDTSTSSSSSGEILLFFGTRHERDWMFKEQMKNYVANKTLTDLYTAFSRDQEEKHYVQDEMRKVGSRLYDLITLHGAFVYVCGDGVRMAKDVHECLVDILVTNGKMESRDANDMLKLLSSKQRYVRDIWS